MNYSVTTKLAPEKVIEAAVKYFGEGGLGLEMTSQGPDCVTFQGGGGHVEVTACQKEMKEALIAIKTKGLFFIDSLTTPHSMAYKTAKRLNMATACRNIFLDNLPEKSAILTQLNRLKRLAVSSGYAIGIGHPHPETAAAIECFINGLNSSAISLVHISSLIPA